jgi:hypothetical protein
MINEEESSVVPGYSTKPHILAESQLKASFYFLNSEKKNLNDELKIYQGYSLNKHRKSSPVYNVYVSKPLK